jgi:uncharacterized membrane protein
MAGLIDLDSMAVVLLGIIAATATLGSTRRLARALPVLLDLLTAAGLLHLTTAPSYQRAATAAAILVIRHLLSWGLAEGPAHIYPGREPARPKE